ncbi:hypothetical protein EIB18_17060 [Caulobacter vibrioides]|uniref:hypothetical protein n=1 Tax=Caulobacter TaxID=75 RepID=UPI000BB47719|nr:MULTISPECIES: hypothetical protein [Caulobacter]ATC26102.1 hypothetical protein CA608_16965 [Caulobacter vibrioides]AZH14240.1 hypothetical protein EIB18_17060 [Caulobacter vibrioides]MCY1645526.1 hypothetical protein [Caulobacter sp. SL161]PLR11045.1 hypothetical protein CVUC_13315 [Caulobacter vibrioides]
MEKVFVAQRVATKLFATEAAVDAAMIEVSGMMAELMQARKDLGLSATVGDAACSKVADAIQALAAARSALVEAHSQLDETRLRVGIRTRMGGLIKEEQLPPPQGLREVV